MYGIALLNSIMILSIVVYYFISNQSAFRFVHMINNKSHCYTPYAFFSFIILSLDLTEVTDKSRSRGDVIFLDFRPFEILGLSNALINKPNRNIIAPNTCHRVIILSTGKMIYDNTTVNPFRIVDTIAEVIAPNLFVSAAKHDIPRNPTLQNSMKVKIMFTDAISCTNTMPEKNSPTIRNTLPII